MIKKAVKDFFFGERLHLRFLIAIIAAVIAALWFIMTSEISPSKYKGLAIDVRAGDCRSATSLFDRKMKEEGRLTVYDSIQVEHLIDQCYEDLTKAEIIKEVETRETKIKWHRVETPEG